MTYTYELSREEICSILEEVIGWLESGQITDVPNREIYQKILVGEKIDHVGRGFFAMQALEDNHECGTVACIGGWMDVAARNRGHLISCSLDYDRAPSLSEKERHGLYNLFMNWDDGTKDNMYRTGEEAAKAARVWLSGEYISNPWFPDEPALLQTR